jgi:hypothetical protein
VGGDGVVVGSQRGGGEGVTGKFPVEDGGMFLYTRNPR